MGGVARERRAFWRGRGAWGKEEARLLRNCWGNPTGRRVRANSKTSMNAGASLSFRGSTWGVRGWRLWVVRGEWARRRSGGRWRAAGGRQTHEVLVGVFGEEAVVPELVRAAALDGGAAGAPGALPADEDGVRVGAEGAEDGDGEARGELGEGALLVGGHEGAVLLAGDLRLEHLGRGCGGGVRAGCSGRRRRRCGGLLNWRLAAGEPRRPALGLLGERRLAAVLEPGGRDEGDPRGHNGRVCEEGCLGGDDAGRLLPLGLPGRGGGQDAGPGRPAERRGGPAALRPGVGALGDPGPVCSAPARQLLPQGARSLGESVRAPLPRARSTVRRLSVGACCLLSGKGEERSKRGDKRDCDLALRTATGTAFAAIIIMYFRQIPDAVACSYSGETMSSSQTRPESAPEARYLCTC